MPRLYDLPSRISLELQEAGIYREPLGLNCLVQLEIRSTGSRAWATLKVPVETPSSLRPEARKRSTWEAGMALVYALEWGMKPETLKDGFLVFERELPGLDSTVLLLVTGRVRITGLNLPVDLQECPRLRVERNQLEDAVRAILNESVIRRVRGGLSRDHNVLVEAYSRRDFFTVSRSLLENMDSDVVSVLYAIGFLQHTGEDETIVNMGSGLVFTYTRLLDRPVWCALKPLMVGAKPWEWDPRLCNSGDESGESCLSDSEARELMRLAGIPV